MKGLRSTPAPVVGALSWVTASAAAWFAIGDQVWGQTALIFAVGGLYLLFPPSGVFPRSLLALMGLLLLLAATAFLPAGWFGAGLRQPFLDRGIVLPGTFSFQPWYSLEDVTLLVATFMWAWSCFEVKIAVEQREVLITGFLGVLGLIAVVTIFQSLEMEKYLPPFLRGGGQFENRNHTGDLLVMGGIFSFARSLGEMSRNWQAAFGWVALTLVFMTAVIVNNSRAGLLLFGLGLLLSYNLVSRSRHRRGTSWMVALVVAVVGLIIFACVGGALQERFLGFVLGREGRLDIYQDAFSMVRQNFWHGVGLGNFEGIFNTMRAQSGSQQTRCLHPESDWLWLAADLGVGGVVICALMVFVTFRDYLGDSPFPSLTKTSSMIAILFLIHSFVDVGGHCLGTLWSCLYLVGLGAFRTVSPTDGKLPRPVLRLAGLLLLVVAALRVQSTLSGQPLMPTLGAVESGVQSLRKNPPFAEQKAILDRCISWAPLEWYLYFRRGLVSKEAGEPIEGSDADFNRALYLEQSSPGLPLAIGEACRGNDPKEAVVAWKELLKRAGDQRVGYLNYILEYAVDDRSRLELADLAGDDPNLRAEAVNWQSPANFEWLRQNFLDANPTLKGVTPAVARSFFDCWVQRGDLEELIEDWPYHPEWQTPGWSAYARALAKLGRYQDAVAAGLKYMPPPSMPDFPEHPDEDEAMREHLMNPKDPYFGIRVYFAQISNGENDVALQTLTEVAKLPNRPDYIEYLLAKSLYASGRYSEAWLAFTPLLDGS